MCPSGHSLQCSQLFLSVSRPWTGPLGIIHVDRRGERRPGLRAKHKKTHPDFPHLTPTCIGLGETEWGTSGPEPNKAGPCGPETKLPARRAHKSESPLRAGPCVRSCMPASVWTTRPCLRVDVHVNSLREVFPSLYIHISLGDVPFYADRPEEKNRVAGRQKLEIHRPSFSTF